MSELTGNPGEGGTGGAPEGGAGDPGTGTPAPGGGTALTGAHKTQQITNTAWREALDEGLRNDPSLGPIESLNGLAKSYIAAQKMIGADKIVAPNEHTTDEQWGQIYNRLGRPETADKYELQVNDSMNKDFVQKFRDVAHKSGLSNKQVSTMFDWYNNEMVAQAQAVSNQDIESRTKTLNDFKSAMGESYEPFLNVGVTALTELEKKDDFKGIIEWVDKTGFGDDPMFLKVMNLVGQTFMEDKIHKGAGVTGFGNMTVQEIDQQIAQINANPAFLDRNHPEHNAMVSKATELHQLRRKQGATNPMGGFNLVSKSI